MKILILGGTGQLGHDLGQVLHLRRHEVTVWGEEDLDISKARQVRSRLGDLSPDVVANLAAFTSVDEAEKHPDRAQSVNVEGAGNVAEAARAIGASILYISSDYVFDGRKRAPYVESDTPNPLNVYGRTKRAGELLTMRENPNSFIVRTAWLFSSRNRNFPLQLIQRALDEPRILVVQDQIGSPTWTGHLAQFLARLLETDEFGTHHAAGTGEATWYEVARTTIRGAVAKGIVPKAPTIEPMDSETLSRPAERPAYSVLGTEREPVWRIPPWQEGIEEFLLDLARHGIYREKTR